MKILHVLNKLMPSGAEVMLRCSAPYFGKEGFEGEILSTGEEVGSYAEDLEEVGYHIHHIPFKKGLSFFLAFYKLIQVGRYNIVHVHSKRASFYIGFTARLAGARIVRTIHSTFLFSGSLAYRRGVQRRLFNRIGGVTISISPSVRKNELERFGSRTSFIPNWYDSDHIRPPSEEERAAARKQYGSSEEDLIIISVGNCGTVKNHPELLKALAEVSKKYTLVYFHVGKEEDGYPEQKLAKDLGITDQVQFLGHTKDILTALHAADIYVMPSLREGFSVAALEALGAGLPTILSDVPGLRDFKDIPGVFYSSTDAGSLAQTISKVAAMSNARRATIVRQASSEVKSKYGMECGAQSYVDIYKKLTSK